MPLNTVRLSPTMTMPQLIAALNQNFAAVENVNRTMVMKDETGTNRIIIGRFPNGEWGIIISKPGNDVLKYQDFV